MILLYCRGKNIHQACNVRDDTLDMTRIMLGYFSNLPSDKSSVYPSLYIVHIRSKHRTFSQEILSARNPLRNIIQFSRIRKIDVRL